MEKYGNSKRIPGEKKYIVYATILFFIIINLFFLPKSTEGIISVPNSTNDTPISPAITNDDIKNSQNNNSAPIVNNKDEKNEEKNNDNNENENNNNNNEDDDEIDDDIEILRPQNQVIKNKKENIEINKNKNDNEEIKIDKNNNEQKLGEENKESNEEIKVNEVNKDGQKKENEEIKTNENIENTKSNTNENTGNTKSNSNENIENTKTNTNENIENTKPNTNENIQTKEQEQIKQNRNIIRRFFGSFQNICMFSFISIIIYLMYTNGNNNEQNRTDEINTDSKIKTDKYGYALLDDDPEYFENI